MLSTTNSNPTSSIVYGPAGRAIAEAIDSDLLNAIQDHLNMERQAHASYFAAAIWFAERELRGFSGFFRDESNSEHEASNDLKEFGVDSDSPDLFSSETENSSPEDLLSSEVEEEDEI